MSRSSNDRVGSETPSQSSPTSRSSPSQSSSHDRSSTQPSLQPSLDDVAGRYDDAREQAAAGAESLASSARDAAWTTSRAVREQASSLAADIGHELSATAEEQKQRGVEAMHGLVRAIHTAADQLDDQSPRIAHYVRDAAEKVDNLSSNIGNRDVNQLMRSMTDLARSQPMWFFGGAVAAGFALSRFLKSSSPGHVSHDGRSPRHQTSGSTSPGMSGSGMSGSGMSGAGMSGMSGSGSSGAGMAGASGAGVSGTGMSGTGMSGAGTSGSTLAGSRAGSGGMSGSPGADSTGRTSSGNVSSSGGSTGARSGDSRSGETRSGERSSDRPGEAKPSETSGRRS